MNLADIYTKAADIIRANGHTKGNYYRVPEGAVGITPTRTEYPVCAAGALSVVICGDPFPNSGQDDQKANEYDRVAADLARRINPSYTGDEPIVAIAHWNDDPDRTPGDVIAAFEQAAKEAA